MASLGANELTAVEVGAWMSNYIPLFHEDVITYPCPNHNAGLASLCNLGLIVTLSNPWVSAKTT